MDWRVKAENGTHARGMAEADQEGSPPTEKERREWLKESHGLGTNSAWWLAERSFGKGEEMGEPDDYLRAAEGYVEKMFAGKKADLRPLYDKLLQIGLKTGKDVKACP